MSRKYSRSRSRSVKKRSRSSSSSSSRSDTRRRQSKRSSKSPSSRIAEKEIQNLRLQSDVYHSFKYILEENELDYIERQINKYYSRLARLQDFEKRNQIIKKLSKKILGRSKQIQDFVLHETNLHSDMPDRKKKAFQIMLPRIAYFGSILVYDPPSAVTFEKYLYGLMYLKRLSNEQLFYNLPQIFNATRTMIDNVTSAKESEVFVTKLYASPHNLTKDEEIIFNQVLEFYRKTVLTSPLMHKSLEKIKKLDPGYSHLNIDSMIKEMEEMPIEFVKDVNYAGMVQLGGIFINSKKFKEYKGDKLICVLLHLLIHEGFHHCTRHLSNNFAWLIPIGSGFRKGLEGGYLLENYIWGDHTKEVWKEPKIVLDSKRWKCEDALFTPFELQKLKDRIIQDRSFYVG